MRNILLKFALAATLCAGRSLSAETTSAPEMVHFAQPGSILVAVMENGFSLEHHHSQRLGPLTRLFLSPGNGGYVDVPTSNILEIKVEAAPAPPSAGNSSGVASRYSLNEIVTSASDRHRIDADLITSVIAAESGFNASAKSGKGAQGLMQLMPATAASLGVQNAFDPANNVDGGTRYLRELLLKYNGDMAKALAAYNAGPERVSRYGGVPPYRETRAYVARVIREFNRKKTQTKASLLR